MAGEADSAEGRPASDGVPRESSHARLDRAVERAISLNILSGALGALPLSCFFGMFLIAPDPRGALVLPWTSLGLLAFLFQIVAGARLGSAGLGNARILGERCRVAVYASRIGAVLGLVLAVGVLSLVLSDSPFADPFGLLLFSFLPAFLGISAIGAWFSTRRLRRLLETGRH
ncbi:MAG: hypothetical protein L0216_18025 [Planctomycetales bacterium]|nr:hypothetical protein [Planctomycetales bacterium]